MTDTRSNRLAARHGRQLISDDDKYGLIGIVFALLSWLTAIGVVIILGAVAGIVWHERGLSLPAAVRRMWRHPGD